MTEAEDAVGRDGDGTGGARVLLLSGGGRYADPWHPFERTSRLLADLLGGCGFDVEPRDDVEEALAELTDPAARPDLLVLNVGLPRDGAPVPADPDARDGFSAYLAGRRPLLAVHSSATSFPDLPQWEERLGGRWVRGTSMHPEHGRAAVRVLAGASPVVAGLAPFELLDERYTHLRTADDLTVLADHEHEGGRHPLVWLRTGAAGGRTAYDALGHDERSYDCAE
ncbi:ThuA domain-containing protein, partial [Kineococcus glutinatus]|uniref:ThuA domain-containing protein n=1 Tax=Kineococcus glutinatus TaxID=1070872 RepID=UPI0031E9CC6A